MAKIAHGDADAYRELVMRFLPPLTRYGYRMLSSRQDVEDLVQETFLRVWTRAARWQPGRSKLTTWLHTILHNLCIDHYRRNRTESREDLDSTDDAAATPDGIIAAKDREDQIRAALDALPERQRNAIVLCHFQGLSNRDAAEVVGVSVDALESLMARGRRTMRERLAHLSIETGEN